MTEPTTYPASWTLTVSDKPGPRYVLATASRPEQVWDGTFAEREASRLAVEAWEAAHTRRRQLSRAAAVDTAGCDAAALYRLAEEAYRSYCDAPAGSGDAETAAVRADLFAYEAHAASERERAAANATTPEVFATLPRDVQDYIWSTRKMHYDHCLDDGSCPHCALLDSVTS